MIQIPSANSPSRRTQRCCSLSVSGRLIWRDPRSSTKRTKRISQKLSCWVNPLNVSKSRGAMTRRPRGNCIISFCEDTRVQYLSEAEKLSAGLVAATALANAESSARETAAIEHLRHADRVANQIIALKKELEEYKSRSTRLGCELRDAARRSRAVDMQLEKAKYKLI